MQPTLKVVHAGKHLTPAILQMGVPANKSRNGLFARFLHKQASGLMIM